MAKERALVHLMDPEGDIWCEAELTSFATYDVNKSTCDTCKRRRELKRLGLDKRCKFCGTQFTESTIKTSTDGYHSRCLRFKREVANELSGTKFDVGGYEIEEKSYKFRLGAFQWTSEDLVRGSSKCLDVNGQNSQKSAI